MKRCKHCQSEIDDKAKICPVCKKSQKNGTLKFIRIFVGVIIAFIGIGMIFGAGNSDEKEEENACYATLEKFNQIQNGMTYKEVTDIIGCEGTLSTESSYGNSSMAIYYWYAKNGISNMNVNIMNGKVTAKAQLGLDK